MVVVVMKYLLIMQLVGMGGDSVSIQAIKLDTLKQCNEAKSSFLNMKYKDQYLKGRLEKNAECVELVK